MHTCDPDLGQIVFQSIGLTHTHTHIHTLKIQIRKETGMEFIRDVGPPKPDSSNSNQTDFTMGSTRCPYCCLFVCLFPHRDLGMLFWQFNK